MDTQPEPSAGAQPAPPPADEAGARSDPHAPNASPSLRRRLAVRLARLGPHRGPAIVFAAFFLVGTYFYCTLYFYGHPAYRVGADGRYYYAYLLSAWKDHDLDFSNQYAPPENLDLFRYGLTSTGRHANPYTVGPAILWTPFFAVADATVHVVHHFRPSIRLDGMSDLEQAMTMYGTFVYAFLALLIAYRIALRRARPWVACLASSGAFLGSCVVWYAIGQTSYSHALSAFAATLFFDLWDPAAPRREGPPSLRRCLVLGLALGLAADVRPVDAALCLLPVVSAIARLRLLPRPRLRGLLGETGRLALIAAASLVAYLPQMLAWHVLYGRLLTVPMGSSFMHWTAPRILDVLFSTHAGLYPFTPLWWIATFVGLPLWLKRRDVAAIGALLVFLSIAYLNGAANDWWAGLTFAGRRFSVVVPLMTGALAVLLESLTRALEARPARAIQVVLVAVVGLPVLFTLGMLRAWCHNAYYDPHGLPWANVVGQGAGALADEVESVVGDPLAWPANALFALRHHAGLDRFDVISGSDLDQRPDDRFDRGIDLGSAGGRRFLLRGFGDNLTYYVGMGKPPPGPPPVVSSPACIAIPINGPRPLRLSVQLRADGKAGRMSLTWNGAPLAAGMVSKRPAMLAGRVARDAVNRGTNELCIATDEPLPAMKAVAIRVIVASPP